MPTYQYRCTSCAAEVEAVQRFTDDPLTECPECAGDLRKVFNAVGVVFKGSGFYATDNRSKTRAATATGDKPKTEGKAVPKAEAPASTKTEAKAKAKVSTGSTSAA